MECADEAVASLMKLHRLPTYKSTVVGIYIKCNVRDPYVKQMHLIVSVTMNTMSQAGTLNFQAWMEIESVIKQK